MAHGELTPPGEHQEPAMASTDLMETDEKATASAGTQSSLAEVAARMKEEVKDYRGIAVRITPGRCFFSSVPEHKIHWYI